MAVTLSISDVSVDVNDVTNMHFIKAVGAVDELSFDLHLPVTKSALNIRPLKTIVSMTSDEGNFYGRVVNLDLSQTDNGTMNVVCEGAKGFLRDSWVFPGSPPPEEYIGEEPEEEPNENNANQTRSLSLRDDPAPSPEPIHYTTDLGALKKGTMLGVILSCLVTAHNAFVTPSFAITLSDTGYSRAVIPLKEDLDLSGSTCYDAMETIAKEFAMEWNINDDRQLIVTKKFGSLKGSLKTGVNLISVSRSEDASDIYTAILPLGGVGYDEKRLSLSGVPCNQYVSQSIRSAEAKNYAEANSGARYSPIVRNTLLNNLYGLRIKLVVYDDIVVNDPSEYRNARNNLLRKAQEECDQLSKQSVTFSVSALDFDASPIGGPGPELTVYDFYQVEDYITGINAVLRLTKKDFNFDDPLNPSLTFALDDSKPYAYEPSIITDGKTRIEPKN